MQIENVQTPRTIRDLEQLVKDESVMIVYNMFTYACRCYEQLDGKPREPILYDNCWRIRPLRVVMKKQSPVTILAALEKGTECLIRIK